MTPTILEAAAWGFAVRVTMNEPWHEDRADAELERLYPKARDRRALVAFALLKGWVVLGDGGRYEVGLALEPERRRRYEALHGIGRYPREDWQCDGTPSRRHRLRPDG